MTTQTPDLRATFGPVTRTDIVKYAGAGGDFNPLHHDDDYARTLGYPAAFAMGLLTVGYLSTAVESWFGRDRVASYRTKFLSQVWLGDELTCTGILNGPTCTLRVTDAAGDLKVTGEVLLHAERDR